MKEKNRELEFGVDYYPEQWDRNVWGSDFKRIRAMGATVIRIMEFAWTIIEPEEGRFDFSLFDEAVELAAKHGLCVVLGTPTATIPAWLYHKDPSLMQIHPSGGVRAYGIRRQPCFNAPVFLSAADKMVEAVSRHYGNNPAVIGWQVDNEIGHEGSDRCVCAHCRKAWAAWLAKKYKNAAAMNETWGTVFWGTTYTAFGQVPLPVKDMQHLQNPGLSLDYMRFMSDSAAAFASRQVDIIRTHISPAAWVSTNLYAPPTGTVLDMEDLFAKMDFPAFDNYPVWGDMDEPLPYYFNAYVLSYIRGLKDTGNFGVFEEISGFQGHACLGYLPSEAEMIKFTHQAVALGADKIYYFRWRTAAFGQEQLCYGILDTDSTDTYRLRAIKDNIASRSAEYNRFASVPFESEACLVYDRDNSRIVKNQNLSKGLSFPVSTFAEAGYDLEMARSFAPFSIFNINADVKSARSVDLSKYKIISLPVYQIADPAFVDKLDAWVRAGGTLILGWRAGARDMNNHNIARELPGIFSNLAGVRIKRFESLNAAKTKIKIGLIPGKGEVWADILEPVTAKVIARYADKKKHYKGSAAVTVNSVGKGKVYYVGTSPDPAALFFLYRKIFKAAGIKGRFRGMGLEVVKRKTVEGKTVEVAVNHTAKGKRFKGRKIKPFDFRIIG
ncbi:MAG: beta-galactosidase [Spirochaetota bacterium]